MTLRWFLWLKESQPQKPQESSQSAAGAGVRNAQQVSSSVGLKAIESQFDDQVDESELWSTFVYRGAWKWEIAGATQGGRGLTVPL